MKRQNTLLLLPWLFAMRKVVDEADSVGQKTKAQEKKERERNEGRKYSLIVLLRGNRY